MRKAEIYNGNFEEKYKFLESTEDPLYNNNMWVDNVKL